MTAHRWVHLVLARLVRDFEENPRTQISIHKFFIRFWAVNFVVVSAAFFLWPEYWLPVSVYYLTAISLYANFATDYDALSAAQASLHGQQARDEAKGLRRELEAVEQDVESLKHVSEGGE